MKRRFTAALTALCMLAAPVMTGVPDVMTAVTVHAEESGTCGENVIWTLDDAGTLTISGTGKMKFNGNTETTKSIYNVPWKNYTDTIKSVIIEKGVTSIEGMAFSYCTKLTSVTIPGSVINIEGGAFHECTSLTSVTIPDSVRSIEMRAFHYCTSLTSVTIPDSVTSIGYDAFGYCTSLTSVTIPDSVTSIEAFTFNGCRSLTSVTIPDSVTSIGRGAFGSCKNLTSVTILNPKCEIFDNKSTFSNDYENSFTGTIYGYEGSTAQSYAKKYGRKFEVISGTPSTPTPTESSPQVEPYSPGEVNGDGVINASDATEVLVAAAKAGTVGSSGLTAEQLSAADVNKDGAVNAKDATIVLRYAAAVGNGSTVSLTEYVKSLQE